MKIAYADPPYIGQAKKHYAHDPKCAEVDHMELISRLEQFDGWALSAGNNLISWRTIVPLLPDGVRVCAWVKPFASFKPNVTLAYAWEPIFVKPARSRPRTEPTCRDWVAANITLKKGLTGAKPIKVCQWLFDALGAQPDDCFTDLYEGTGIVGDMWQVFAGTAVAQGTLFD